MNKTKRNEKICILVYKILKINLKQKAGDALSQYKRKKSFAKIYVYKCRRQREKL